MSVQIWSESERLHQWKKQMEALIGWNYRTHRIRLLEAQAHFSLLPLQRDSLQHFCVCIWKIIVDRFFCRFVRGRHHFSSFSLYTTWAPLQATPIGLNYHVTNVELCWISVHRMKNAPHMWAFSFALLFRMIIFFGISDKNSLCKCRTIKSIANSGNISCVFYHDLTHKQKACLHNTKPLSNDNQTENARKWLNVSHDKKRSFAKHDLLHWWILLPFQRYFMAKPTIAYSYNFHFLTKESSLILVFSLSLLFLFAVARWRNMKHA